MEFTEKQIDELTTEAELEGYIKGRDDQKKEEKGVKE